MSADPLLLFIKLLPALFALSIPIVALIGGVIIKLRRQAFAQETIRLRHETLRKFAEQQLPVPPELLIPQTPVMPMPSGARLLRRLLHSAIMNIATAVGLMALFYLIKPGGWLWGIGLLPLLIGVALFIIWMLERPTTKP